MIAELLRSGARRHAERTLLHGARGSLSYAACRDKVERLTSDLRSCTGARLGLVGSPADWLLAALIALDELGARAYLIPPDRDASQREALCATLGLDAVLEERGALPNLPSARPRSSSGEIVLFSSGTAGAPKAALHTWASLASRLRVRPDLAGRCWLLGYGLASFAGIQVVLHTLANGGTLVIGEAGPVEAARLAREQGVTHASGTPSYFRLLLSLAEPADLTALKLAQITLGGEAADQGLLDALRRRFPAARLTQIYASTELGVCFSVHDGRAGFPAEWLTPNAHATHLCVVDGELLIRSPAAMRGYLEAGDEVRPPAPLFPTGDLVEVRGDRAVFLGRRGLTINVGGRKAFPAEIEAALLEVAGVRAVRVSGVPSALVGQLVRAQIVLESAVDPNEVRRLVLAHCRRRLSPHMVPRRLEFVSSLDHTASRKLARR